MPRVLNLTRTGHKISDLSTDCLLFKTIYFYQVLKTLCVHNSIYKPYVIVI